MPVSKYGSKDPRTGRTWPAFVVQECGVEVRKRITDNLAVYTAELMATVGLAMGGGSQARQTSYLL